MRYGDQEQSSFRGTHHPLEASQTQVTRTSRQPPPTAAARSPEEQAKGGEARLAEQDEARQVPHQRQASPWRVPRLRRPQSLRTLPSLARFLTRASLEPGDTRAAQGPRSNRDVDSGRDAEVGGGTAADEPVETRQDAVAAREALLRANAPESPAKESPAPESPAPESSAAELRELAELSDLLAELAGLVHDLGALIIGLMTAATGAGDRQVRTFTIPPELTELAAAHQELKAGQRALSARFKAAGGHQERVALRGSLAALTERATRAVGDAAAAVTPQENPTPEGATDGPDDDQVPGTSPAPGTSSSEGTPSAEESGSPSREETGVQTSPGGTTPRSPREPVQGKGAGAWDRPRLAPVAVALDAPDIDAAARWATLVTPYVSTVKIGLELYLRYGPTVVATVRGGSGVHVFLDLKLHDIPNTVAGAARAVAKLRPEILTVHAAGGADMIKAAVEAAPDTIVAGVTLLTSIGDKDLIELGIDGSVSDAVRRMAALAVSAGARGLVCSPQEVAAVRAEVGPGILLITPGIRLAGATSDDQARVATPEEALKAGADLLVIGRPITKSPDPGAAAAAIASSLRRAVLFAGGATPLHPPIMEGLRSSIASPRGGRRKKHGAPRAVVGLRAWWLP
jgi:orotidine-5'-phosphate decarboxylase